MGPEFFIKLEKFLIIIKLESIIAVCKFLYHAMDANE
jgi:hypothetical protein